jgi:DNA-directed RNA polymerase specialized sigma24 family protein
MDTEMFLNNDSRSDTELMEAVDRRESDAIQEIYRRYESGLRTVIQSVLHEDGEIDEALNDVFLQLWNQADRLDAAKGLPGSGPGNDLIFVAG